MKIRDLIDELIQLETEHNPDIEVEVEMRIEPNTEWHGCFIEGTGHNEDGSPVIRAVAP